jgi:hypothetical protein
VCSRRAELVTRGRPYVQFHASVPLKLTKGAQFPLFDLKYLPLGRARCITKSETFNRYNGLPLWWSDALFVCVLRPVLARGLPSRA